MRNTNTNQLYCDKCGREIGSKGYITVNGWVICGICQYASGKYTPTVGDHNDGFRDQPRESQQEYFGIK
jgi:hypothetical protein